MDIKQILAQNSFHFNKQYGQNFLTDTSLLADIVADANIEGATVVEVGAGAGTLTRAICDKAKQVFSFEIDRNLEKVLATTLADKSNVKVIIGDIMRYKMQEVEAMFEGEYCVVANIPYYITTPLLMKFVEGATRLKSLTLTIQQEVADRLTATPSTKDYGAITVGVDSVANATITRRLGRELFYPVPNVDSAVVHIEMVPNKYPIKDKKLFDKLVKSAFAMRRKTLVNNLINGFQLTRPDAEKLLSQANLPIGVRGEELSTMQFVTLGNLLAK